jgi:hypothetical protein
MAQKGDQSRPASGTKAGSQRLVPGLWENPESEIGKSLGPKELRLRVEELRARIEQRRQDGWEPKPGHTAREKTQHWKKFERQFIRQQSKVEHLHLYMPELRREKTMTNLGRELLKAAERGNDLIVGAFIEEGFPANYQDPITGQTVLHVAAGTGARDVLRLLIASGVCYYLVRDRQGRLASELAFLFGRDPAVAHLLRMKERTQADAQGVKLTRREKTSP